MLTLMKNYIDENKSQKRINVKKIVPLKELINKPYKNITFKFNEIDDLHKLKNLSVKDGNTEVKILMDKNSKIYKFELKDKRKINNQVLNTLNLSENVVID